MFKLVVRVALIGGAIAMSSCNRDAASKADPPVPPAPAAAPVSSPAPSPSAGPTDSEAIAAIRAALTSRGHHMGDINFDCSTYFSIGDISIRDRRVSDGTARIDARAIVTSNTTLEDGAGAGDICFGQPRGGWVAGEPITHDEVYRFERWDSGWRLADR